MSDKKKSKKVNVEDIKQRLEEFLNNNKIYFGLGDNSEKYKDATTRYDAWIAIMSLSNLVLIDKIDELISIIKKQKG